MRVAVAGAGAIGGFLAAALGKSGANVSVVARGEHLRRIQAEGLYVRSERLGEFSVRLDAAADLRELQAPDVIFATFKAHQWGDFLPQFAPFAKTATTLVTMQNGLPFWYFTDRVLQSVDPGGAIAAAFDPSQVVGGVVHSSARIVEPGLVEQAGDVHYPIGEVNGAETTRIRDIEALFTSAGLRAPVHPVIRRAIWLKVLGNISLNPLSALTRARVSALFADRLTFEVILALMRETLAVAAAAGIDVGITAEERVASARQNVADVKTSMLQDLEAGRPLEIEPIMGAVLEVAGIYGVATPHVRTVYALLKRLDATLNPC